MLTVIDQVANQHHLQLVKAILPYIQPQNQRTLSLLIKVMELQNVMAYYSTHDVCMNACGNSADPPSLTEILADIRNYCDESEQGMIDQFGQMLSMLELYSMMAQQGAAPFFMDGADNDDS